MSDQSRILRTGARAVTGLLVAGVCASAVVLLGSITLPSVDRDPISVTVNTEQNTEHSFVCAGSFSELGADPTRPGTPIPVGTAAATVSGDSSESLSLTRAEGGEGVPAVFSAPSDRPFAAAQIQAVKTEALRGVVASACAVPVNEQWLLGGASSVGVSTTLSLGNPGTVPATVRISVYDENGPVDAVQTAGVLVAPGSEQSVSLNGYAPGRERLAVRVESTGAPVTASLGVGQSLGIQPFAVSSVDRQAEPSTMLVVPGVSNTSDDKAGPSDAGEGDEVPVVVRVMATDDRSGTARVAAIDDKGKQTDLGEIALAGNGIGELQVAKWPVGASAVVIEADVPVIAGVLGSATSKSDHDYEWFAPAPVIAADQRVAAAIVPGGQLVIANPGDEDAEIVVESADGKAKPVTVRVVAGSSQMVKAPANAVLTSSAPIFAGVRYLSSGDLAAYPVLPAEGRSGELTVFPR